MTKVSPFMGGLGIDARDKLEVAANATVTVGAGSTTPGNVNIGDTGQAAFGQATDLRIFHDGTDSQIVNSTGQFNLRGDDVRIENNAGDETGVKFTNGGSVEFYHNNIKKLETSAVGVKVTGNVDVTANVGIAGNAFVGSPRISPLIASRQTMVTGLACPTATDARFRIEFSTPPNAQ